ncbi:MAG: hypothetical protein IJS54_04885 [Desulfovibrio sp.]|nr:hypothetical protein [Desulfovibrio sp.]
MLIRHKNRAAVNNVDRVDASNMAKTQASLYPTITLNGKYNTASVSPSITKPPREELA